MNLQLENNRLLERLTWPGEHLVRQALSWLLRRSASSRRDLVVMMESCENWNGLDVGPVMAPWSIRPGTGHWLPFLAIR